MHRLSLHFAPIFGQPYLRLAQHADLVAAQLGAATLRVEDILQESPSRDNDFQSVESGVARWTCAGPHPWIWETAVERPSAQGDWTAHQPFGTLVSPLPADHPALLAAHRRLSQAVRHVGYRPRFRGGGALRAALTAAGQGDAFPQWRDALIASLVDATPQLDPRDRNLAADGLGPDGLHTLLEGAAMPDFYRILDLRHNGLEALPASLARFGEVVQLRLTGNPLSPDPTALRRLFPHLVTVEWLAAPPTLAAALAQAGYRLVC